MQSADEKKKIKLREFFSVIIAVVCCAGIFPVVFSSCASKMTDEEAQKILMELVPKSEELNKIFWGEGLPVEDRDKRSIKFGDISTIPCGFFKTVNIKVLTI